MDIYITFFSKTEEPGRNILTIANGFSFFDRDKNKDYIDLYFNRDKPTDVLIKEISKRQSVDTTIYCSLSLSEDLALISPLMTDKWVLGGPFVSSLIARGEDVTGLPGKFIAGYLEVYQGKERLSCQFDPYFRNWAQFDPYFRNWAQTNKKSVAIYNCSIGKGCYWNKCKFCDYLYFNRGSKTDGKISFRPNISDIVEQLHPLPGFDNTIVHLGTPAVTPKVLRQILESKRDKQVQLNIFVRADDIILDVLRDYKDRTVCQKLVFIIGCESLSQFALDKLNKGTTVENTIELTKLILDRGGHAAHGIMDHYPFANGQMVTETLDSLKKLKEIISKYSKVRTYFYNNGPIYWPTKKAVSEFSDDYWDSKIGESGYTVYMANIEKGSDAFDCNKQISLALKNSGIPNYGEPYESLR